MSDFREFIEEVRAATDIVDLIGGDIQLRASGSVMRGLSPFHAEDTPSFVVWPHSQSWHDFSHGSGLGGDAFAYVQESQSIGFKEAVFYLAERASIQRPGQDDAAYREELEQLAERRSIERLLTKAAAYYHRVLPIKIREEVYRDHYGFTDETIDRLQLGWGNGGLYAHFIDDLGVSRELALKTGLFIDVGERPKDFFQHRAIFPYWRCGQVVYFSARRTEYTSDQEWEQPKYKKLLTHSDKHPYVSPWVRNDVFYNEDAARRANELVITEGVTDCISTMQAEVRVISPTTARFRRQDVPKLVELTKASRRVIICNDSEENGAGVAGALQTAQTLYEAGRDVRIAELPRPDGASKIDVNEFLKAHTVEDFRRVLDAAKPYLQCLIDTIPADTPKLELEQPLRPVLEALCSRSVLEQDGYIDLIHERFGIARRTLKALLRTASDALVKAPSEPKEPKKAVQATTTDDHYRGKLYEEADHYYVVYGNNQHERISSFQFEPTERIKVADRGEMFIGDVTTIYNTTFQGVRLPPSAWISRRNFLQVLQNADMQWYGTDNHCQGLLAILSSRAVPTKHGTDVCGYLDTQNGPRWITPELILGPDGPDTEGETVYVHNGSTFPGRIGYPSVDNKKARELAQEILPLLLEVNEPAVVLPILGWFFACPFKPAILSHLQHFPILMVWGTAGSGKTSIIREIFWPLVGITSTEPYSATETEFALLKLFSATNAIPVFLDEYKPSDMPQRRLNTLHRLLRRVYGGEVDERGRADQSIVSYHLSAPIVLAGEARPEDPALVDRLVSVTPDRNRIAQHPEHARAFHRLRALDLRQMAAPYIQWSLGRDTASELKAAIEIADTVIASIPNSDAVSPRCRDNLRVVVFGLSMFEKFAADTGVVGLPELDVEGALTAVVDDLMDGEQGGKNQLDDFIETLSVMAYEGDLIKERHFTKVNGLLCLHLLSCWALYLEHCRKTGQTEQINGIRALRRMLKENQKRGGYVKELSKRIVVGDQQIRCACLDLERAKKILELDGFPDMDDRGWGGNRYASDH